MKAKKITSHESKASYKSHEPYTTYLGTLPDNMNRHFHEDKAPRPLDQTEQDIEGLEKEIMAILKEVV